MVGGGGTVAVVILTAWLIPEIRRVDNLSDHYVLEIEDLAHGPRLAKAGKTQNQLGVSDLTNHKAPEEELEGVAVDAVAAPVQTI